MDFVDASDSDEDQGPFAIQHYVHAVSHVQYLLDLSAQARRTEDPDSFDRMRTIANDVLDYFCQFSDEPLLRDYRSSLNSGSLFSLPLDILNSIQGIERPRSTPTSTTTEPPSELHPVFGIPDLLSLILSWFPLRSRSTLSALRSLSLVCKSTSYQAQTLLFRYPFTFGLQRSLALQSRFALALVASRSQRNLGTHVRSLELGIDPAATNLLLLETIVQHTPRLEKLVLRMNDPDDPAFEWETLAGDHPPVFDPGESWYDNLYRSIARMLTTVPLLTDLAITLPPRNLYGIVKEMEWQELWAALQPTASRLESLRLGGSALMSFSTLFSSLSPALRSLTVTHYTQIDLGLYLMQIGRSVRALKTFVLHNVTPLTAFEMNSFFDLQPGLEHVEINCTQYGGHQPDRYWRKGALNSLQSAISNVRVLHLDPVLHLINVRQLAECSAPLEEIRIRWKTGRYQLSEGRDALTALLLAKKDTLRRVDARPVSLAVSTDSKLADAILSARKLEVMDVDFLPPQADHMLVVLEHPTLKFGRNWDSVFCAPGVNAQILQRYQQMRLDAWDAEHVEENRDRAGLWDF